MAAKSVAVLILVAATISPIKGDVFTDLVSKLKLDDIALPGNDLLALKQLKLIPGAEKSISPDGNQSYTFIDLPPKRRRRSAPWTDVGDYVIAEDCVKAETVDNKRVTNFKPI